MLTITTKNEGHHKQQSFEHGQVNISVEPDCNYVVEADQSSGANFSIETIARSNESSKIRLSNCGRSIALSSGPRLHRGRIVEVDLPVSFCIGRTQYQIFDSQIPQPLDEGLATLSTLGDVANEEAINKRSASPGPATLGAWLEILSELQQVAAGSRELFDLATQAIFNPGGLDGGLILGRSKDGWCIESSYIPYPDHGICYREDLVQRVAEERQTLFHDSLVVDSMIAEGDLHCAVACPVFDIDNNVAVVIYAFRSLHRRNSRQGIRHLETQFVQVVADSLSAGLIRLESEAEAARSQVLLEQMFSPNVANQLRTNPQILDGQDKEVSVLFADMRGFSSIAERIGTHDTYELLSDVMDRVSTIIMDLDGVIIDYYGDGVSAFWNAPFEQPEHAAFACQAAMEILACLPELNAKWGKRLGEDLKVGIGVNTGISRVGNSGSRRRLKYGPRGTVVNVASRLENMTKEVGIPILISQSTANAIEGAFTSRRIAAVELKGHQKTADVFQIYRSKNAPDDGFLRQYDEALTMLENGDTEEALAILDGLAQLNPTDEAIAYLLNNSGSGTVSDRSPNRMKTRSMSTNEAVQK